MHPKADEAAREKHQLDIALLKGEGRPIVYIDESGFEVDSCRDQGYTKRGQRCKDTKDWQAKGRINAIGALLVGVLLTIALFTGTINSDVFYQWIVDDLLPKLPKNAVLVMDNASFHKRDDIQKAIRGAGFDLSAPIVDGINSGYIDVVIDQQPFIQGYMPIVQLYLSTKFGMAGLAMDTGAAFVTKANIDAVAPLAALQIR